jgi:hypothetical protein
VLITSPRSPTVCKNDQETEKSALCSKVGARGEKSLYTDGRTPWTGDQAVARPLPTHRTTQPQNKRTQISMP